ncbi:MAG TPA: formate/nitrite transporter family protein [Thermomicrobiales bacterium]|nr:formate transporter FocA [Chloroflexota bacterium]HBY47706.1 formate transporter FocA [Chloroflexota bacterium]HCG28215.1 formate transporter FocA [Chloroflexota bacterium]HQZ90535.1 formate/nitrite transporter family protein [Thermomicrobiales bacterium]HRA32125.1 formate/nitrite transporter family protein [Thermomicrobiales bacterium]
MSAQDARGHEPVSITVPTFDPYAPAEMARRVELAGVTKAGLDVLSLLTLAVLAGAFIALGAQLATVVGVDSTLGFGPTRLLVGVAFSLGLILVVIAGAELFTGNTLIVMAWLGRQVSARRLLRNWSLAYLGNFIGALGTVALVYLAGQWALGGNKVGAAALSTANAKVQLSFGEAIARGILCNTLVNLAVWLCFSARSNVDKVVAIVPAIAGFVASGFEHSVANMYFVPLGILLRDRPAVVEAAGLQPDALSNLTWSGFLWNNLLPVTIGNIIGGGLLVAAVYWLVYLRPKGWGGEG